MPCLEHLVVLALASALAATPALADGKDKGHGKDWKQQDWSQHDDVRGCPPGLAKKSPSCVPPGLAKKQASYSDSYDDRDYDDDRYRYRRGEYLPRDADYLTDPWRYRLRDGTYYVDNGYVYRVDPETLEVTALVGLLDRLLD